MAPSFCLTHFAKAESQIFMVGVADKAILHSSTFGYVVPHRVHGDAIMLRTTIVLAVVIVSVGFITPTVPCLAQLPLPAKAPAERPTEQIKAPSGFEKIYELKVAEFDEFTIKDDRFMINNVLLKEASDGRRGQATIKFTASVRNKSKGYENFSITMVGMDEKKTPIWASKASNSVDGNWVGILQDYDTPVAKGTLKSTHVVWVKVNVSANADDND
jgi:hypothetical protein